MDNNTADQTGLGPIATPYGDVEPEVKVRPLAPETSLPSLFPYASDEGSPTADPPQPEPPARRRWVIPAAAALSGALLLAAVLWATGQLGGERVVREVVTDSQLTSATAVARKVVPSIVTVDVGTGAEDGVFTRFGSGSGVVISSDGLIVTNHHVVSDADIYQVIFGDGRKYDATLVGSDQRTDLAVLRINAADLIPIEIGSSHDAEIGQTAIAVGSPLGLEGGPSVTVGVLSAFGRQVRTGATSSDVLFDMIQTDAPITQGSSGGALVDAEGKLLGITSAIGISAAGAEGIGFAIPVELMTRITNELIETGTVEHPFIGVRLDNAFVESTDGSERPAGAYVVGFVDGVSTARDAGIAEDDLIVAYDGNEVLIPDDLISGLREYRAGDTVTLSIKRGTEELEIAVVLGIRPENL